MARSLLAAETELKSSTDHIRRVSEERRDLSLHSCSAADYVEMDAWLDTLARRQLSLVRQVREARVALERQRGLVGQLRVQRLRTPSRKGEPSPAR
jgi:hypothetical protein